MSHNIVTAPGPGSMPARAIAAQWDDMKRIKGQGPTTLISSTYPADGQRRIPATGWVRSYQPGSHEDRGGARPHRRVGELRLPYRHVGGRPSRPTPSPPAP